MNLLAIDPGVAGDGCACAYFRNDRLAAAWFGNFPVVNGPLDVVLVERPQVDERTRTADAHTIVALAWHGARAAAYAAGRAGAHVQIFEYTPTEWKGSEPKAAHHSRLLVELDARERSIVGGDETARTVAAAVEKCAKKRWPGGMTGYSRTWVTHNILDAVCLGLFHIGRLGK